MVRIFGPLVGLFFAVAALWAFLNGAIADAPTISKYGRFTEPTAEKLFHIAEPKPLHLQSDGPFGTFNKEQLQRGFAVYDNVCKACHSLSHVSFRDLEQIGYSEAEVKAIAKTYQVPHYNAATGEVATADGKPTDHFPPVVYAGQGSPPDLSAPVAGCAFAPRCGLAEEVCSRALPELVPDGSGFVACHVRPAGRVREPVPAARGASRAR